MAAGNNKPSLTKYNEQEALNLGLGQAGVAFLGDTDTYTPPSGLVVVAIQFVEDTVLDSGTTAESSWPTNAQAGPGENSDTIGSTTFLAGMTIYGRWKTIDFASGKALLYLG